MKAGWEVKPLGEVCSFENGDRGKNYPGKKCFVASGVPFINAGLVDDGEVLWDEMNFIPEDRFKLLSRGKIQSGDFLFCLRGSLGKFGHYVSDRPAAIASSLVIIRPIDEVLPNFFAYYLRSAHCASEIERLAAGAAQPNLGANDLKTFSIPIPPLEEQKRIVAVLDAAFEGLTRAKENAETNLQNARELFVRAVEERFEQLLEAGQLSSIGEIAQVKGGKRLPKGGKFTEGKTDFPYISVKSFTDDGSIDETTLGYLDQETYEAISRYIIRKEDMYISIAGTIGKTGIIPETLDGANLTENAARLIFVPEVLNKYVYYFSKTATFQDQVGMNTRVAAQPKLALVRLKTVTLPIVDMEIQREVVAEFDRTRLSCVQLETDYRQKLTDIADLRQSLLQKAFAGELT